MSTQKNKGFLGLLILLGIALLLLAYFSVDLRGLVESETFKNNAQFVKEISVGVWESFLKGPSLFIWSKILLPFIIEPLKNLLAGS
jgi:hypothetical protein